MRAFDRTSGRELAGDLKVASTLLSRSRGLLGRRSLPVGEGLLIRPCKGVHTFFMNFPIDVVFLDRTNRIIETVTNLQPYRITRVLLSSDGVIELPAGTIPASERWVGRQIVIE